MSLGQSVQQKGGPLALEGRGPAVVPGALALYFCTPQARGLFPQQRKEVVDPEDRIRLVTARTDPPRPALRSGCSLLPAQHFSNHSSLWGYNPHVVKPTFEVCRSVVFSIPPTWLIFYPQLLPEVGCITLVFEFLQRLALISHGAQSPPHKLYFRLVVKAPRQTDRLL